MPVDLQGVFAPIVTPFRISDGEVDYPWMAQHVAYLRGHACDGLVVCGTNGEATSLSVAERQAVLEAALHCAGHMPVIAGTGAAALPDAITLTRHAFSAGAAAVLVTPPFFLKHPPDAGLVAWYTRLCDAAVPAGGRLLLYHIPQVTAVPITDSLLEALLQRCGDKIYGIKDSTGDREQGVHLRAAFPSLAYFCGNDHLVGPSCVDGGAGSITAAANVFPDAVKAVQRAAEQAAAGQAAAAAGLAAGQSVLDDIRSTLERYSLQPATKAALHRVAGLPPTAVRPPQTELEENDRQELGRRLAEKLPAWRPKPSGQE